MTRSPAFSLPKARLPSTRLYDHQLIEIVWGSLWAGSLRVAGEQGEDWDEDAWPSAPLHFSGVAL